MLVLIRYSDGGGVGRVMLVVFSFVVGLLGWGVCVWVCWFWVY